MLISKALAEQVLGIAVSSGADFAEIYQEYTKTQNIHFLDGKIDNISDNRIIGAGIRAFIGTKTVYACTSDISEKGLVDCARAVSGAVGDVLRSELEKIVLTPTSHKDLHPVRIDPFASEMRAKADLLRAACVSAKEYDEKIGK